MFLKRYRGETVRAALSACRQDLGPDALVLSTTMVAARGWRGMMGGREVELTAGVDREASAVRPSASETDTPRGLILVMRRHGTSRGRRARSRPRRGGCRFAAGSRPTQRIAARLRDALTHRLTELAAVAREYQPIEVFVGPRALEDDDDRQDRRAGPCSSRCSASR
jgi:flagellar biosynthesis GTPase FlhF